VRDQRPKLEKRITSKQEKENQLYTGGEDDPRDPEAKLKKRGLLSNPGGKKRKWFRGKEVGA